MNKCQDTIQGVNIIAGCDFIEQGSYLKDGKMWQVLKCEKCGHKSEAWTNL